MKRAPRVRFAGWRLLACLAVLSATVLFLPQSKAELDIIDVEGQPLAANVERVIKAFDLLGQPLPSATVRELEGAAKARDAKKVQQLLDPLVLVQVTVNPESRVKAMRGPAKATLQQAGYTPILLKVVNEGTVSNPLRMHSPQAGYIVSGGSRIPPNIKADKNRFLDVEVFNKEPMTQKLSGLKCEYAIGLIYSAESGKREATLGFDVGQGTQDQGFRGEVAVLFDIRPAIPVTLSVRDFDGAPSVGRFTFKDKAGHVYPSQAKRLAPDFFFQEQVYRKDGGTVLLPPGELTMWFSRGPEYKQLMRKVTIPEKGEAKIEVKLERWINTMDYGFYSGDHHIHAAGCAHYTNPTEGVFVEDMFLQVKGEGLNVGCNLTWGPCYEFQRQFFEPKPNKISELFCVIKYDVEVSGFGSQAMGHVCLLNLRDQTYPNSMGTKEKGWPTWTTPLMRWAKKQGAVTGYAHSASGLNVIPQNAAGRILKQLDSNKDGLLSKAEADKGLIPEDFARIDTNGDGNLNEGELIASVKRTMNQLPNLAVPELGGIGAQEVFVTSAMGVCDFISAMDTQRVPEWNCWYHIMNCGFPLKVSGETDFPCISGSRVGEGRVYVQLGKVDKVDFDAWCEGLAKGRSYVSDGYAHALEFKVSGKNAGEQVDLASSGKVNVTAKVAFASETPLGTAKGGNVPAGKMRKVELIVNGQVVASKDVPADDKVHDVAFNDVEIKRSSWVAIRQFPQMHTNPVDVIVAKMPIRASRQSALWCIDCIEQLWRARQNTVSPGERDEAKKTFDRAVEIYRKIAEEAKTGS
jgi:hypothetical protein